MLKTRFITSIISLVILGAVLFVVPAVIAQLIITAVILIGAWEWSGFLTHAGNTARSAYVAVIAALMAAMLFVVPEMSDRLLQLACVWWFVAFLWTFAFPTPIPTAVRWLCGVLVLVPLFVALLSLYRLATK